MLCLSYYCLFLLFNGTREKHRTVSAWNWGREEEDPGGGQEGEMTQTMYAHVNKLIILKKKFILVSQVILIIRTQIMM
jgi:hypothetical protein